MSEGEKYIRFLMGLVLSGVFAWCGYNLGYMHAQETYQVPTKYRCHQNTVHRWTGGYWEITTQPCRTDEQMKGAA